MLSRDSAVVRYGGIKNEPIAPWTNVSYIPNYPIIDDFTNSTAHSEKQFSGQQRSSISSGSMELSFDNSTGRAYSGSFGSGGFSGTGAGGGFFQSQNRERPYSIRNLTSLAFQPGGGGFGGGGGAQMENYTEPKYYLGNESLYTGDANVCSWVACLFQGGLTRVVGWFKIFSIFS